MVPVATPAALAISSRSDHRPLRSRGPTGWRCGVALPDHGSSMLPIVGLQHRGQGLGQEAAVGRGPAHPLVGGLLLLATGDLLHSLEREPK